MERVSTLCLASLSARLTVTKTDAVYSLAVSADKS